VGRVHTPHDGMTAVDLLSQSNFPVARLVAGRYERYEFQTISPTLYHGTETHVSTVKPDYLGRAVLKTSTKAYGALTETVERANDLAETLLRDMVVLSENKMISGKQMHIPFRDYVNHDDVADLIAVFFNEKTVFDISQSAREKFETIKTERDKCRETRIQVGTKMEEIFGVPKWFITYLPNVGYNIYQPNVGQVWSQMVTSNRYDRVSQQTWREQLNLKPLKFVRSLDDLNTEWKESLLASLTWAKMHYANKSTREVVYDTTEGHDLVPYAERFVFNEAMGAAISHENDLRMVVISQ
jgi:hypothetical protein